MHKDYRDQEDYIGTCALLYAILSADADTIATYDEEKGEWIDRSWNEKGNYVADFIPDTWDIGVSVQDALDRFGVVPE